MELGGWALIRMNKPLPSIIINFGIAYSLSRYILRCVDKVETFNFHSVDNEHLKFHIRDSDSTFVCQHATTSLHVHTKLTQWIL